MLTPIQNVSEEITSSLTHAELPTVQPDERKIAVLLNRNAKQVSDAIVKRVERIVGRDHVYYSRSLEEGEAFAREIVQKGYGTIVSGGGDGTLSQTINMIHRYIKESNQWRVQRFERFGDVAGVEIVRDKAGTCRGFAYLDMLLAPGALARLQNTYNGAKWRGAVMRIGVAKESFMARLQREWAEAADPVTRRLCRLGQHI